MKAVLSVSALFENLDQPQEVATMLQQFAESGEEIGNGTRAILRRLDAIIRNKVHREIHATHNNNQRRVNNANNHLNNCVHVKNKWIREANKTWSATVKLLNVHNKERREEVVHYRHRHNVCKVFYRLSCLPRPHCQFYGNWRNTEGTGRVNRFFSSQYAVLSRKGGVYHWERQCLSRWHVNRRESHQADVHQTRFERKYCAFRTHWYRACHAYSRCYNNRKGNFKNILAWANKQWNVYNMNWNASNKVRCFITVLINGPAKHKNWMVWKRNRLHYCIRRSYRYPRIIKAPRPRPPVKCTIPWHVRIHPGHKQFRNRWYRHITKRYLRPTMNCGRHV